MTTLADIERFTYAQLREKGWRDAQLRALGYTRIPSESDWMQGIDGYIKSAINSLASMPVAPAPNPATPTADEAYRNFIDRTDAGNANLLIKLAGGNLRYVAETKQWLRWTGTRWQVDTHEVFINSHALEVAKHYLLQAGSMRNGAVYRDENGDFVDVEEVRKFAAKCRSRGLLDNMVAQARKVEGVPISVTELDRNPWLLGVENGVVDLRTGELRQTEAREDYVTKRCPFNYYPDAKCPRWEAAIEQITGAPIDPDRDAAGVVVPDTVGRFTPRPQIAHYVRKALGYSITGAVHEQLFFLAVGDGSNGKSVIFGIMEELLGPYAKPIPSELFIATKRPADAERPTSLAASLAGVRLVVSTETRDGQQLDIGVIKAHTGDASMTARGMRQDPFTFKISHKPWLLTNSRPTIEHLDAATRGRLHFIPFDRRWNRPGEAERNPALPDGDKTLMGYLIKGEAEGILAWLVRGAMAYQSEGLKPPAEVIASTSAYFMEQDTLGRWLATLQRCRPHEGMRASDLFAAFGQWCVSEGTAVDPNNTKAFSVAMGKRDIENKVMRDGTYYGLRRDPVASAAATDYRPPLMGSMAAAAARCMTPAAGIWTREQYHAAGWTDEMLVTHGKMVA